MAERVLLAAAGEAVIPVIREEAVRQDKDIMEAWAEVLPAVAEAEQ